MAKKEKYPSAHSPLPPGTYVHPAVGAPGAKDIYEKSIADARRMQRQDDLNKRISEAVVKTRANFAQEQAEGTTNGTSDGHRTAVNQLRLEGDREFGGYMTPAERKILEATGTLPSTKVGQKAVSDSLAKQQQVQRQYTQSK